MKSLRILHLEDNLADAELVCATLTSGGLMTEIVRVDTRAGFEAALASPDFDVILADYNLPTFDGVAAQMLAAERTPDIPFIFLSGSIGEDQAIERVKAGATDYVLKDRMGRLPSAVERALAESAERAERKRADDEVRRLNAELEERVIERTRALEAANQTLAARERELRESQARFQGVLDNSPEMIYVKDLAGRYLLINRQFARLFTMDPSAIIGKTDFELFAPRLAEMYRANDARVLATGEAVTVEEPVLANDAVRLHASSKFPLRDSHGTPYEICGISFDITDRKIAEDQIKVARLEAIRANRAKSDFLSRMSHDLRTPLNAILGFAQLLASDDLDAERMDNVQQILKGGRHLLELVNEVLDIARIESGYLSLSPEPVNAREIVEHAVALVLPLAATRGITVTVDQLGGEWAVLADRRRLNQILLNLLSNAVKYNREHGSVTVSLLKRSSDSLRITVTDTGGGIPADKLALLFTPFQRLGAEATAVEGTGLGLALSRGLAEAMGASIGVESEVDRGTKFWIELALTEEVARAAGGVEAVARAVGANGREGTILYVEDNMSNVRLMERIFQRRPRVKLLHAGAGRVGIAMAREHRPDAIFLDMHLPDISGDEVLAHLLKEPELSLIPVAVLSADATDGQARRLIGAGAAAYLTKPLEIVKVLDLVDNLLAAGHTEWR